jgi:mRNA interferase RelE/StbE
MKVVFLEKFIKDLDKITDRKARQSIKKAILKVENAPSMKKITGLKRLKGVKGTYRLRIGDYRIGFYYEKNII